MNQTGLAFCGMAELPKFGGPQFMLRGGGRKGAPVFRRNRGLAKNPATDLTQNLLFLRVGARLILCYGETPTGAGPGRDRASGTDDDGNRNGFNDE